MLVSLSLFPSFSLWLFSSLDNRRAKTCLGLPVHRDCSVKVPPEKAVLRPPTPATTTPQGVSARSAHSDRGQARCNPTEKGQHVHGIVWHDNTLHPSERDTWELVQVP